ncbi:DUF3043 domain-containing protein [Corynebacterium alimapuense]|uniref:DUF3043 domain-containing protein n=1 Tax=Corynebacterium alimapuense TaxID=1576874 RepID=UPI0018D56B11|nr:DUF3043 domain-containing protein [Corynebacterium alimapuense]
MKLPWQKSDETTQSESHVADVTDTSLGENVTDSVHSGESRPKSYTPPKGRPTPRRRDVEIERGVMRDPAGPSGGLLGNAKNKELKKSMSKEEWKEHKRRERAKSREQSQAVNAAMDRGEEKYLLPRDKGVERRFVRDWIDSRRFLNNYVMPVALGLLVILFIGTWLPTVANVMSLFAMILMFAFFMEGVWLARRANRATRAKFPNTSAAGFGLGFYAYSRATQPRKWRSPKPQVEITKHS